MTQREFYETIKTVVESTDRADKADLIAYADSRLTALDTKNEKRRNTPNKKQKENEVLKDEIKIALLASDKPTEYVTASAVAVDHEISTQKATALLKMLVDEEVLEIGEVKASGGRKVKGYRPKTVATDNEENS